MKSENSSQSPRRRRAAFAAAALVLLGLATGAAAWWRARSAAPADDRPTFQVQAGPLTISVNQSGTIRALEQEIITSEVEGTTTIIFLIDEGTRVKAGDLLVELDASKLQDDLVEQQIKVQNAEAAYIRARENLSVTRNQAESDIALAELNHQFAQEDLTQYTEGDYRQELRTAESKITLAEEELQLAARKMEWSEKLYAENYISQSERDADRLSHKSAALELELAQAARKLLEDFTYTRKLAKLKSDIDQTRRALERARLKATADIVQAEADLKAKEAEWHQQQTKEEKAKNQIAKTKIHAPREGLVVYATSARSDWHRNQEPLDEGQTVRERQELIYLPTADRMLAVVQVHESALERIAIGLPVTITVDALPGRTMRGRVVRIAPLPDAASMWMNPDLKVYRTEIEIEGSQPELRTGMSCMAEIVAERYDQALFVPIQAVLQVRGKPTVYVRRDSGFAPVAVETGLDNNRMIRVLSGLREGDKVLLAPPLQEGVPHGAEAASGPGGGGPAPAAAPASPAAADGAERAPRAPEPDLKGDNHKRVEGAPDGKRGEERRPGEHRTRSGGAAPGGRAP